jgi:hypothetical protein
MKIIIKMNIMSYAITIFIYKKNLIFQGASAYKEKGDGLKENISTSVLHFFLLRSVIY